VRRILINAASVARHNPGKFWHPSRAILARLRRSTEVQLRVVEYDEKEGADLWENEPIWVGLTSVGPRGCIGRITVSGIDADDFRVGDVVRFTKDRIFDVWELGKKGELLPNRGKAGFVRGKDVIVGLTYLNPDGRLRERVQFHGFVEVANTTKGIGIRRANHDDLFTLPPDFRSLQPARPGTYRLKSTGEVVEDPALECTWTIKAPSVRSQRSSRMNRDGGGGKRSS
jgi:hypothetical protein